MTKLVRRIKRALQKHWFLRGRTPRDLADQVRELRDEMRLEQARKLAANALMVFPRSRRLLLEAGNLAYDAGDLRLAFDRYATLLKWHPRPAVPEIFTRILIICDRLDGLGGATASILDQSADFESTPSLQLLFAQHLAKAGEGRRAFSRAAQYVQNTGVAEFKNHAELSSNLFKCGYAIEAYELKDLASTTYLRSGEASKSPRRNYQIAAASSFCNNFAAAKEHLENTGWSSWDKEKVHAAELMGYCRLMTGEPASAVFADLLAWEFEKLRNTFDFEPKPDLWHLRDFVNHFRGKSVAIVGPADTGQNLTEEIDCFDLVARTNVFSLADLDLKSASLSSRVDVAYYTTATHFHRSHQIYALLNETDVIGVFRRPQALLDARELGGVKRGRVVFPSPKNFVPSFNNMHAVQRMMWDLLKLGVGRLKLFNVSFYAGSIYHAGYTPKGEVPSITSVGVVHDPLQSFLFTQNLFRAGIIEADPVASEVLGWERGRYIEMLQRNFADQWKRKED